MKPHRNAILPGLLLLLHLSALSQQPTRRVQHLTLEDGLSHNQIFSICQDREGFMWFGTPDGLNKYDGYTVTAYQPDPNNPANHMAHNTVWDILENRAGELWFATTGEGIHRIDKRSGQINYFRLDPTHLADRNICYTLTEDRQAMLWVGSQGGLMRFDPHTKRFILYTTPVDTPDKTVWSVLEDRFGTLWVGTSNGLFTLDRRSGRFTRYPLDAAHPQRQHLIISLYQDSANTLWVASLGKALYRLEPIQKTTTLARGAAVLYRQHPQTYLDNLEVFPNGILEDLDHTLLLGTHGRGIKRLDKITGRLTTYAVDPAEADTATYNLVWSIYRDRTSNLWVGTTNGVSRESQLRPKFSTYQLVNSSLERSREANTITSLFDDRQGVIWFSNSTNNYHKGLYRLDLTTHQLTNYRHDPAAPGSLHSDWVTAIYEDRAGTLWVATPEGLHARHPTTGSFRHYPAELFITTIAEDATGRLWVGGTGGIARFDPLTGQYVYYRHKADETDGLGSNRVKDLLVSRSGAVWVATFGGGLRRLSTATNRFVRYQPQDVAPDKIAFWNDVLTLYEAPGGTIWGGTNMGGLFSLDPGTGRMTTYTTHNGLPNNYVPAVLGDEAGRLWLATNKGVCRFDPRTKQVRRYDEQDGLQGRQFTGSHAQGPKGQLLFGGTNGFSIFSPAALRDNPYQPPVYITKIDVLGKSRFGPGKSLTLSYQENLISFQFVALNYVASDKNQYAYQLEGVDQDWVYCGTQRRATYTQLAPGTYTFRVKAANNDGIWNQTGTTMQVIIHPPWWQTWWAYCLYGLLLLGALWLIITLRSRALVRKNYRLEAQVAQRTHQVGQQAEELRQQRDNLATTLEKLQTTQAQLVQKEKMASLGELTAGIAHEIQNPLNFVNNFSEVSIELVDELTDELAKGDTHEVKTVVNDLRQNLQKITHHGHRASSIIKAMLEHSRTGTGERRLTDLNALVDEYLRLAYQGQRRSGDPVKVRDFTCELVTHFDPAIGRQQVMNQEMGRVLLNLFTNAFYAVGERRKRADASYQPLVTVSTVKTPAGVEIRVGDNGIGMSPAVQQKIFQPFFTTKPAGEGTGLGLSLSYDIVTKGHQGSLVAHSQPGKGSEFVIQLPTTSIGSLDQLPQQP